MSEPTLWTIVFMVGVLVLVIVCGSIARVWVGVDDDDPSSTRSKVTVQVAPRPDDAPRWFDRGADVPTRSFEA